MCWGKDTNTLHAPRRSAVVPWQTLVCQVPECTRQPLVWWQCMTSRHRNLCGTNTIHAGGHWFVLDISLVVIHPAT